MKKLSIIFTVIIISMGLLAGCSSQKENTAPPSSAQTEKEELIISAAASLKEALEEIKQVYSQEKPNTTLTFNFGASGALQKQIEQGAPADLFISAGKKQMDELETKSLVLKETRIELLGNDLVLIVPKDNLKVAKLEDLTNPKISKVSIGTPETVPAGKYAQEALTSLKLWQPLQSKLVLAKDVKQVVAYVETGNVDAGLVYASDAKVSDKSKIVAVVPRNAHKPIIYPAALIANSQHREESQLFLQFLTSPTAMDIFQKYGFKAAGK